MIGVNDEDDESPFPPCGWLEGDSMAPPCQAERDVVEAIVDLAGPLGIGDVLWDLGCGDGRIPRRAAARWRGCRAAGVEIEMHLVEEFRAAISNNPPEEPGEPSRVRAVHGDIMEVDFSDATVVVVYLLPEGLEQLRDKLVACLDRGCRIVCNTWGIPGLEPTCRVDVGNLGTTTLLLYCNDRSSDVFVTRHGARIDNSPVDNDADWLRKAGHGRRDDAHLSPSGEEAAVELAAELVRRGGTIAVRHIVSSPFVRCVQTALPVAKALGLPIKLEPGICEVLTRFPPGLLSDEELQAQFRGFIDTEYRPAVPREALAHEFGDTQAAQRAREAALIVRRSLCKTGGILFVGHGASCLGLVEAFGGGGYVGYTSLSQFRRRNQGDGDGDGVQQWQLVGALGNVSHLSLDHAEVARGSAW